MSFILFFDEVLKRLITESRQFPHFYIDNNTCLVQPSAHFLQQGFGLFLAGGVAGFGGGLLEGALNALQLWVLLPRYNAWRSHTRLIGYGIKPCKL